MKRLTAVLGALLLVACGTSSAGDTESSEQDSIGGPDSNGVGATLPPSSSGDPTSSSEQFPSDPTTPNGPSAPPPGTPPLGDGGAPPPAGGAFAGAPAYVATLGPSTLDTRGAGKGHLSFTPTGNPAGRACLDCHTGERGDAPRFVVGGTIYEDAAGKKPVARAEVRVLGANGTSQSAYTDINGNFFVRGGGSLSAPAIAGIRNATVVRLMTNKINDGSCNQCHTAAMRITL